MDDRRLWHGNDESSPSTVGSGGLLFDHELLEFCQTLLQGFSSGRTRGNLFGQSVVHRKGHDALDHGENCFSTHDVLAASVLDGLGGLADH